MFDFRLKVFHTVAHRLNFTKAAEELCITQPAVSKHVQEIEHYFKVRLFERNGSKIKLTEAGGILLQYTNQIFSLYGNLEFELGSLREQHSGTLRIGASTTIAQYVLPPVLAAFHDRFRNIRVTLMISNTEQIESALQSRDIDFGIIEGQSRNSSFRYTEFIRDEIVLVAASGHPLVEKGKIEVAGLPDIPLLLREPGSGTLEVIAHALKPHGISFSKLQVEMQLGSTESIKSYLLHSGCMAFLSVYSVRKELKNKEMSIVDVEGLEIGRYFHFIRQHGDTDPLSELFIRFTMHYNLK